MNMPWSWMEVNVKTSKAGNKYLMIDPIKRLLTSPSPEDIGQLQIDFVENKDDVAICPINRRQSKMHCGHETHFMDHITH